MSLSASASAHHEKYANLRSRAVLVATDIAVDMTIQYSWCHNPLSTDKTYQFDCTIHKLLLAKSPADQCSPFPYSGMSSTIK